MPEKIVLHGMNSPNVVKVIIMLEECELDYDLNHVAVFKQEQFAPEFLNMNPIGKVPVLEDPLLPGQPISESGAILMWLAERERKFLPAAAGPRAETIQWLMHQMATYGPMLGQLNHFSMVLKPGTEPYAEGRYRALAERLYRILDDRLSAREWLAGSAYSIADMAMQPWGNYLELHGFDPAEHPALVEWRGRIAGRPAVQRALARVAQDINPIAEETRKAATGEDLDKFFGRTEKVPEADFSMVKQ